MYFIGYIRILFKFKIKFQNCFKKHSLTYKKFDKDAFEILVKQVIIGGYDEKDKADPKQVTFVLKNESKVNYEDYLQTRNDISQKNLQMSNHTSCCL